MMANGHLDNQIAASLRFTLAPCLYVDSRLYHLRSTDYLRYQNNIIWPSFSSLFHLDARRLGAERRSLEFLNVKNGFSKNLFWIRFDAPSLRAYGS